MPPRARCGEQREKQRQSPEGPSPLATSQTQHVRVGARVTRNCSRVPPSASLFFLGAMLWGTLFLTLNFKLGSKSVLCLLADSRSLVRTCNHLSNPRNPRASLGEGLPERQPCQGLLRSPAARYCHPIILFPPSSQNPLLFFKIYFY